MRRKDREKDKAFAESIADKCEWAVISMITPDSKPYCIPITIVREGSKIYFHSAKEGFKTDCLKNNSSVCISCVGDTCRQTDRFTTLFESAVIRGTASEVTSDEEKIHALKILCERHTPANMADFDNAIERSLARTAVWRIDIEDITGKAKE